MQSMLSPIAVLGAGAWGTALALYLAKSGQSVRLWSIEKSEINALKQDQENKRFLPGFPLPNNLEPTDDLAYALSDVDDVLMVIPSVGYRHVLQLVKPYLKARQPRITSATKGIDAKSGHFLNDLISEVLGDTYPFAVLSGPSFAQEVAAGLPTAVSLATHFQELTPALLQRFNSTLFRVYPTDDVIGVEVGGVLKNVIAIAAGISDGLGFAANTRSALITLGLQEIAQLGTALGAKAATFMGLAGMGDLILTCSDNKSRNRRFGLALGQGHSLQQAESEIGQAIEGKQNAALVVPLAKQYQVFMPISQTVNDLLTGSFTIESPERVISRFFAAE